MAVIVVGDVNREAVAAMIRDHFSRLTVPSPERPRPAYDVPAHPGTRYAFITDKETTQTTVQLSDLRPARNQGSVGGYRDIMKDQLFGDMLGVPVLPPYYAMRLLPFVVPQIETWKRSILRERELGSDHEHHLHGV